MPVTSVAALLAYAGHNLMLQAALIILGTFVLEDAATVLAAMHAQSGGIAIPVALCSLYAGIVLGDLGLYGLGALSAKIPWLARLVTQRRMRQGRDWLDGRVFQVVFVSRFIPGARLPTYTACGFLGADWRRFALAAVVATLIWTSLLFGVSLKVGALLMQYLGAWRWLGGIGFALVVILLGRGAARLQDARR
ncbi:MAG TPA: VTT domain-containing protein [Acetobacteraceae bacterium]|nr:VTT domain-containing protein [Acetobacteraceae bacterium]